MSTTTVNNRLGRRLTEQFTSPSTRDRRHLDTLIQVSRAIGSILDTHQLMSAIMDQVTRAFQADRSTLYLHDPATGQLWARIAQGLETVQELRIDCHEGVAGRVFQTREPMCVSDTRECEHFASQLAQDTGYEPRSLLSVPIPHCHGEQCIGVLQVLDQRIGYFTEHDRELLEAIAVQVAIALDNARLYEAQKRQFNSFVRAFSTALDARDPLTAIHSLNVANYSMGIGHCMGMDAAEQDWLRIAGLLHDVGKIGTPEAVLTKPGKLTDEEYALMKQHAGHSREILSQIEFTEPLKDMDVLAAAHHERLDGSGYPHGLTADQIPMRARILAVADVFDALTQHRHYREGMCVEEAMKVLDSMAPHQLDADCVRAIKQFMGR